MQETARGSSCFREGMANAKDRPNAIGADDPAAVCRHLGGVLLTKPRQAVVLIRGIGE